MTEKLVAETADVFIPENGKTEPVKPESVKKEHAGGTKRRRRFTRPAIVAAALVAAVFVGANIGTYATEKMNVFQYVGEMRNGTAFRVSGDAPMMEKKKQTEIYYSWNEVPNEYREYLIIPKGIPEELELYSIKAHCEDTCSVLQVCYLDNEAKNNLNVDVTINENKDFTFRNLSYIEDFECIEEDNVKLIPVQYYKDMNGDIFAQFIRENCSYTLYGNVDIDAMKQITVQTIEYNF